MAVSIDTVYQRVLALANKEQRGYITPQEFNLFANQAQSEIFEQYFYDFHQFTLRDAGGIINEKLTEITRQKLDIFLKTIGPNGTASWAIVGNATILPFNVYRIARVGVNDARAEYTNNNRYKDIIQGGPLTRPTIKRPLYTEHNGRIKINNGSAQTVLSAGVGVHYYEIPPIVKWGYVVVNEKALYNSSDSTDFRLHKSEEIELVYKILKYAGVAIKREDIMRAGQGMETLQISQEKQ